MSNGIEAPYMNPYEDQIRTVHSDIREYYHRIEKCLDDVIMGDPTAGKERVENECLGTNYSVLNNIFIQKLKIIRKYYQLSLLLALVHKFDENDQAVIKFIDIFQEFIDMGMHSIQDTMNSMENSIHFHMDAEKFRELMELTKGPMDSIDQLH